MLPLRSRECKDGYECEDLSMLQDVEDCTDSADNTDNEYYEQWSAWSSCKNQTYKYR